MIICDTHCDVLYKCLFHKDERPVVTKENMRKGGISLQVCALFPGAGLKLEHPYETAIEEYNILKRLISDNEWMLARSPMEAVEGESKVMLSIEDGAILEGSVQRLDEFYGYGVCMIALTWNRENEIGYPAVGGGENGIKPKGWEILRRMAELGIAADTSHLNEAGFWDLIHHHSQPPMASHSCVRTLCDHVRNLRDDQIKAMIDCGGWIGINFYPSFLSEDGKADARRICEHIDYICQMGGEKNIGFGSDFDGIESTPSDVRTPAEVPSIICELRRRGYAEAAIAGIAGLNFIDYYRRLGWDSLS